MKYKIFLAVTCTLLMTACTSEKPKKAVTGDEPRPVGISRALFHNPDSLLYYAERAYKFEDPKGLYVTGLSAHLKKDDPNYPDSLTTVSIDEGDIMLLHAAELGYEEAIQYIQCLDAHGCWNHSVPENTK